MALTDVALSGLQTAQNGRSYLDSLANRYVVKPKNVKGIAGFVFDYEGATDVQLISEITDHYAEDNSSIQDHIALKPARLTLRGFSAELVLDKAQGLIGLISGLQNKLTTVPAYLGKYTPGALAKVQKALTGAQNTVQAFDQALARVKNIVGFFAGAAQAPTRQAKAFAQLESLRDSRQVFVVETPYKIFDNMAIELLTFTQPDETKFWSDIVVTMKQIRTVGVQSVLLTSAQRGGRNAMQGQAQVDKGKTSGTPEQTSGLYQIFKGQTQ